MKRECGSVGGGWSALVGLRHQLCGVYMFR